LLNSFPSKWFIYNKRKFQIDCYCKDLNLGIEYDGEQHYKPIKRFGGEVELKVTQERDAFKDQACKDLGITLIRIPYTEKNNLENYISQQLSLLSINPN